MTYIEPVPHIDPIPAPTIGDRIRAFLARPTRADLIARLDYSERRNHELAAIAQADRDDALEANRAYNRLLADAEAYEDEQRPVVRERDQLRAENAALKAAHQRACDERDTERARADHLATAAGLVAGAVDGEVVDDVLPRGRALVTYGRLASRRPGIEADVDYSFTGSWNRDDMIRAANEGTRRRGAA